MPLPKSAPRSRVLTGSIQFAKFTFMKSTRFIPLLALVVSCAHAAEKNVIFIITDDESPTLGCYGDPVAKTPAIDAIAADGTMFTNAFATTAS